MKYQTLFKEYVQLQMLLFTLIFPCFIIKKSFVD